MEGALLKISYPETIILGDGNYVLMEPVHTHAWDYLRHIAEDDMVTRYLLWQATNDLSKIHDWIAAMRVKNAHEDKGKLWMIVNTARADECIGAIELSIINSSTVELGCVLGRTYWRMGIMSAAVQKIMQFVRTSTPWWRIQATCNVMNQSSIHLWRKCGFHSEGVLHSYQIYPQISVSEPSDVYMFSYVVKR